MNEMSMIRKIALALNAALKREFAALPAPGREWDPTSWTATGGEIRLMVLARAAVEAMEPTEDMWRAWISVNHQYDDTTQHAYFNGDIGNWRACWSAMIDAITEDDR